jgi:cytohesin
MEDPMKALYALAAACVLAASVAAPALAAASTDLGVAASAGDTGRIKALVAAGQPINARDGEGYTALMWAALNGQVNAISTLITLGANLNVQDREGYTALMWATQNKHTTIVRQLVNAGASVNLRDNHGYSALHWAAQDGQLAAAQMLLQRGADPNARDMEGYTPLMWAAQQGHGPVVYELLAHGANRDFKDRRGYTAYDLANAYYHPEIRKMIKGYKVAAAPKPVPYTYTTAAAARPAGLEGYTQVAVVNPRIVNPHKFHHHEVVTVVSNQVPIRSGVKPRLVAVVNTPDQAPAAPSRPATPTSIKTAWSGSALEARLAKYDVDRNRTIDGRDWRNLTMTTSRIALAQMLHDNRCGKRNCPTHHVNQIMNKLDWVYNDAKRRELTLNQAWDQPSSHFERIRW